MEKIVLKVGGMSCGHCARTVTNAVSRISGAADVSVNLEEGTVSLSLDSGKATLDAIKAAIVEEGYSISR